MSSTADRWFVPQDEFYQCLSDYALVCYSTPCVRSLILETDRELVLDVDLDNTLDDKTVIARYEFAKQGQLLFSDVDDEDPVHKGKVYGEWAKGVPNKEEAENKAAEIIEACKWQEVSMSWQQGRLRPEWNQGSYGDPGIIDDCTIPHILTAKTIEDKEEILHFMSGQIGLPTKRPVLILINMIDSMQTTETGETEGWVLGFDFIKELLVIKPFTSKGGRHPLGGKWHGDVAQDGVSFSGTPQEFAKAYAELGRTVEAGNKADGFRMIVHTNAAKWIVEYRTAFEQAYGTDFNTDLLAIQKAMKTIIQNMKKIKFPDVEMKFKKERLTMGPFLAIQCYLEDGENALRDAAAEAKDRGEEKIAHNAAKLYESLYKQIKAFNENPSLDLDL